MPSAIVKTIFFDLDKLAWTITAGGNALLQPLTIGQNDTIDFNVQFIKGGVAQTLTAPTFSAGIKVLNGFSDAFVVQFGAPTGTPPTYTFTATISSTELSAALLTGVQFAIEFRDSTNGIVTLPALTLNIVASYTISGTTPTSANGTLNVAAGKTVTFPQSLTFPSALGTNGFQLTTDGAGALTWAASGALTDGDKGEITVSNSGAQFTIDNDVVTLAKLAHMPTARVIGRTTGGTGSPELLTISGTGSVAMTNTPTLVTPVLGDATATSINGITISAGGSGTLTMSGSIDTSSDTFPGGSIDMSGSGFGAGGSITTGGGTVSGGNINTENGGGSINTSGGGGTIDTTGTGSIQLGVTGTRTTFTGAASGTNKSIALPNLSGTVVVTAATSATATQALFAQATGFPAYRAIATADIATALASPGTIGNTTAATSVKIANGSAASTALQIGAVLNGIYSPSAAGTDVGISANGSLVAFWNSSWGLVALQPIIPNSNGVTSVGTSGLRWSNVFSVLGNFSGAVTCSTTLAVSSTTTMTGRLTANGGITVVGGTYLLTTNSALNGTGGSATATLTNSPGSGNPTKWIAIDDHGTERYIPTWTLDPP